MSDYYFMKKENAAAKAKELRQKGYKVRRSSHRAELHPMYVEDYPRQLTDTEKGFGNTLYKTLFNPLYIVETQ